MFGCFFLFFEPIPISYRSIYPEVSAFFQGGEPGKTPAFVRHGSDYRRRTYWCILRRVSGRVAGCWDC